MQRAIGGKVCTGFEAGLAPLARVNDDAPLAGRSDREGGSAGEMAAGVFFGRPDPGDAHADERKLAPVQAGEKWWMGKDRMRAVIQDGGLAGGGVQRAGGGVSYGAVAGAVLADSEAWGGCAVGRYTVEKGVAKLREYGVAHPEAEIAVVLLNQRVIAGLGNVYKSEVAFAAGVNPFRAMSTMTDRELEVMAEVSAEVAEGECAGRGGGWDRDVQGQPAHDGNSRIARSGFGCTGGKGRSAGGAGRWCRCGSRESRLGRRTGAGGASPGWRRLGRRNWRRWGDR